MGFSAGKNHPFRKTSKARSAPHPPPQFEPQAARQIGFDLKPVSPKTHHGKKTPETLARVI
jgi:hypothetical protein